jgi:hypothetical protein
MLILLTIFNLIGLLAVISKRNKLLSLAEAAEEAEEKSAFLRSAESQIWKIILFGISCSITVIMWIMIWSSPH